MAGDADGTKHLPAHGERLAFLCGAAGDHAGKAHPTDPHLSETLRKKSNNYLSRTVIHQPRTTNGYWPTANVQRPTSNTQQPTANPNRPPPNRPTSAVPPGVVVCPFRLHPRPWGMALYQDPDYEACVCVSIRLYKISKR